MKSKAIMASLICLVACQSPTSVFQKTTSSIVKIEVETPMGMGSGSGVVVDTNIIVTNAHVVGDASHLRILDNIGNEYTWHMAYVYHKLDLAFLVMEKPMSLPVMELDLYAPKIGDKVYTIGCPLGMKNVLSDGLFNGVRCDGDLCFTLYSAPISPGSSGGALLSKEGKLLGITCASFRNSQGMNLAVPAYMVGTMLRRVKEMEKL